MKNYEEVAQEVFRRRDEYNQKMAKRRRTVTKAAVTFSCFCVVVAGGIFAWQRGLMYLPDGKNENVAADIDITEDSQGQEYRDGDNSELKLGMTDGEKNVSEPEKNVTSGSASGEDVTSGNEANGNDIVINDLEGVGIKSNKMAICLLEEDFISMSKEELNNYYGINVFPYVPFDLPEVDGKYGIYQRENGTGEIYWDQNRMIYANEDRSRSLDIEVCKETLPLTDLFFSCEMEKSIIQGNEVEIGTFNEDCYYVEMIYENVGFRMNAMGFSEEEILSVVTSILQ